MFSSDQFHKDFLHLKIATQEIGLMGMSLATTVSQEALSALIAEPKNLFTWKASHNTSLKFQIDRETDQCYKVQIQADLRLSNTCVRCLNQLNLPFSLNFSIRMLERETMAPCGTADFLIDEGDIEIDMSADDDKEIVGYFSKRCIDLGLILREQIFLEVPDYPHCESNKSGPGCGQKGALALDHQSENKNNPFAKLLKKP